MRLFNKTIIYSEVIREYVCFHSKMYFIQHIFNNKVMLFGVLFAFCFIDAIGLSDSATIVNNTNKYEEISQKTRRLSEKTFQLKGWMVLPMLVGGLLKVVATIPLILAAATIIGALSLISSKLALLISTVLAVRAFLTPSPPPPKEMPPLITADEFHELQYLLAKQQQNNMVNQQHQEMDYSNYLKMATDANAWNRKYVSVPRYFPENLLFATPAPLTETSGGKATVVNNQELDEAAEVAGVHIAKELEMTGGRNEKWHKNSGDKIKILVAEEMAARANALLETEASQYPDRRVGVRVTKTVTKLN